MEFPPLPPLQKIRAKTAKTSRTHATAMPAVADGLKLPVAPPLEAAPLDCF